jgi:hypothetical protein
VKLFEKCVVPFSRAPLHGAGSEDRPPEHAQVFASCLHPHDPQPTWPQKWLARKRRVVPADQVSEPLVLKRVQCASEDTCWGATEIFRQCAPLATASASRSRGQHHAWTAVGAVAPSKRHVRLEASRYRHQSRSDVEGGSDAFSSRSAR